MSDSKYWQRDYSKSSQWTRKETIEVFVTVNTETKEVELDGLVQFADGCTRELEKPWAWMRATLTIEDKV